MWTCCTPSESVRSFNYVWLSPSPLHLFSTDISEPPFWFSWLDQLLWRQVDIPWDCKYRLRPWYRNTHILTRLSVQVQEGINQQISRKSQMERLDLNERQPTIVIFDFPLKSSWKESLHFSMYNSSPTCLPYAFTRLSLSLSVTMDKSCP